MYRCLLAYPVGRHLVLVCVAHLQIVAEHVVVGYFQARNARALRLSLLDLQQIVLSFVGNVAQFVQFGVHAFGYHPTLVYQERRVVLYLAGDAVADGGAQVQLLPYLPQRGISGMLAGRLDRFHGLQGGAELHHVARRHSSHRHFGDDALQVAHLVQLLSGQLPEFGLTEKIVHHVEPPADGLFVFQGKQKPAPQQAGTHRRDGVVHHAQERLSPLGQRTQQLQIAHGELVQTNIALFLDARNGSDMPYLAVLRHLEI